MVDGNETNIRPAIEDDVPVILDFVRDLARYERAGHEVVATEALLHSSLFGQTCHAYALIAEYGDRSVGFAMYFFSFSTWQGKPGLYLEDLYVAPEYRKLGIGRMMLKALAQIALDHECGRFEWSVLDWNEQSIIFYENLGAEPQSDWIKYRLSGESLANLASS